jgi:hypothetical protein
MYFDQVEASSRLKASRIGQTPLLGVVAFDQAEFQDSAQFVVLSVFSRVVLELQRMKKFKISK